MRGQIVLTKHHAKVNLAKSVTFYFTKCNIMIFNYQVNYALTNAVSEVVKESSINDVTDLGGENKDFCDDSIKATVINRVTMGRGGGKKLRDVIYR